MPEKVTATSAAASAPPSYRRGLLRRRPSALAGVLEPSMVRGLQQRNRRNKRRGSIFEGTPKRLVNFQSIVGGALICGTRRSCHRLTGRFPLGAEILWHGRCFLATAPSQYMLRRGAKRARDRCQPGYCTRSVQRRQRKVREMGVRIELRVSKRERNAIVPVP